MGNWVKFSYVNLRKQAQPADKHCGLCCHAASSDSSLSLWLLDSSRCHYIKCFYSSLWHIEGRLAEASINISDCVAQLTSTFFPFITSVIYEMNFANVLYNNMRNDEKNPSLTSVTRIWKSAQQAPGPPIPVLGADTGVEYSTCTLKYLKYVPIPWHRN